MPRELKKKDDNESAKPSSSGGGSGDSAVSPNVLRVVIAFRRWGWFAFWVQVVLGVISTVILLTLAFYRPNPASGNLPVGLDTNPATLPGLGFTWVGLAILAASILWNFRYTRLANKLRTPERPTKSQTLFQLKIG
ncbi:MAG: DUF3611 family protein, partial [Pseudanabaena sp. ELA607]